MPKWIIITALTLAPAFAQTTINRITLWGGSWNGTTFSPNGHIWDTIPANVVFILGVSGPSTASPLLNAANGSVNLAVPGTYFLYGEPAPSLGPQTFGTHVRITVGYSTGGLDDTAVFAVSSWIRVSGATNLALDSPGVSANRVGTGETVAAGGAQDLILRLVAQSPGGPQCSPSAANLLGNGSFEQPGGAGSFRELAAGPALGNYLPCWTITAGSIDYVGTAWSASDGGFSLDMSGLGVGTIVQTFATTPGSQYTVAFDLAGNFGSGPGGEVTASIGRGHHSGLQFHYDRKIGQQHGMGARGFPVYSHGCQHHVAVCQPDERRFWARAG